jgi:hypothetical protein
MNLPSAIIFINADINDGVKSTLVTQLYINESMSDVEYDKRLAVDPWYPQKVHFMNLRILVIRQNFRDYTNRESADVVIFYNQGQATIEKNKFGPPGLSLPIQRLDIWALLRGAGSANVVILPHTPCKPQKHCNCDCKSDSISLCGCLPPQHGMGGIVGEELSASDASGVHLPNCDNIYNNPDFINRK